jgi:hypothetical protein
MAALRQRLALIESPPLSPTIPVSDAFPRDSHDD